MSPDGWITLWSLTLYGSLLGVVLVSAYVLYGVIRGTRD